MRYSHQFSIHTYSPSSANLGLFLLLSQLFIIIIYHYYHNIEYILILTVRFFMSAIKVQIFPNR